MKYFLYLFTVELTIKLIPGDRTADLIVLPPLVLGYDELYSEEEKIYDSATEPNTEIKPKPKIVSSEDMEETKRSETLIETGKIGKSGNRESRDTQRRTDKRKL